MDLCVGCADDVDVHELVYILTQLLRLPLLLCAFVDHALCPNALYLPNAEPWADTGYGTTPSTRRHVVILLYWPDNLWPVPCRTVTLVCHSMACCFSVSSHTRPAVWACGRWLSSVTPPESCEGRARPHDTRSYRPPNAWRAWNWRERPPPKNSHTAGLVYKHRAPAPYRHRNPNTQQAKQ
jgi:hypothetical protein